MSGAAAQHRGGGQGGQGKGGDPYRLGHGGGHGHGEATGRGDGGPASKRITTGYGFWIFLLSDIIMFSGFFAAYAVLRGETAGGPGGAELFELPRVAIETGLLLLSSFTCGLGAVATERRNLAWTQIWLLVTGLLGFIFLVLEVQEFAQMIGEGAGPARSAFLSAFFALVGCHGLHVGVGILWCGTMMAQLWSRGFLPAIQRRLMCFNLFWHALDIIWVALFTIVYLMGAGR
ncbi:cytochrome o ubiquinol oxidase subunit III [Sphingomonas aracearum]|uniref:Cytochrome bo(3) ubiquinol oxidase subunit 3 n=1 Tax=Sphingomonas aracearum TaxID=2283317 RepID=A0A369VZT7_9SPHN|nr:cytochrome o ubiquinol oxidase subunit III [Sphingomonas aracearum]RDE07157.1 cytochrome o ubiquinol oxidase subunit III [Sphingomonas aracearum]